MRSMAVFFKQDIWRARAAWFMLNVVFGATALLWIFIVPYNKAPDENNHFHYTVEHILRERRLPVYGVDDVECFRRAASSYNKMPLLNYVVAAAGAAVAENFFGAAPYLGARFVSLGFGLLFLNFLWRAALRVASPGCAALACGVIGFIPQVIFISSYVNADAFAMAAAGFLGWTTVDVLQSISATDGRRISWPAAWRFGAAIGLLGTAKLNFLIYLPWLGVGGAGLLAARRITWPILGRLALTSAVMLLVLSAGWYGRNFWLHGTPLPLEPTPEWLAGIGVTNPPPVRTTIATHLSWPAMMALVRRGFFLDTLSYFYARFGYGEIMLSPWIYAALKLLVPAAIGVFLFAYLKNSTRSERWAVLWMASLLVLNFWLFILYAVTYDCQPQGRYLFPLLVPIGIWLAWAAGRRARLAILLVPLLLINVWLLVEAHILLWGFDYGTS